MSLSAAAHAVRAAVLRHMRLGVQGQAAAAGGLGALAFARGFAGGHFLDKGEVTERVLNVTKHFEKIQADKVTPTASFEKDLGLDSLDVVELVMAFEEEFAVEIPDADADKIATVRDAVDYIAQHPMAK